MYTDIGLEKNEELKKIIIDLLIEHYKNDKDSYHDDEDIEEIINEFKTLGETKMTWKQFQIIKKILGFLGLDILAFRYETKEHFQGEIDLREHVSNCIIFKKIEMINKNKD